MKQFIKFLTKIKSFWWFYRKYGYDGKEAEFILKRLEKCLEDD